MSAAWIDTRHELPPDHERVMTKIHVDGGVENSVRVLRFSRHEWYNEENFALPNELAPTHWRFLSYRESKRL